MSEYEELNGKVECVDFFYFSDVESAVKGLLEDVKKLEQDDGFIGTDFDELYGLIKKWFQDVIEGGGNAGH